MPEPFPAKTKRSMQMNSDNAAFRAAGWLASAAEPISILGIGILDSYAYANNTKILLASFPILLGLSNNIRALESFSSPLYILGIRALQH